MPRDEFLSSDVDFPLFLLSLRTASKIRRRSIWHVSFCIVAAPLRSTICIYCSPNISLVLMFSSAVYPPCTSRGYYKHEVSSVRHTASHRSCVRLGVKPLQPQSGTRSGITRVLKASIRPLKSHSRTALSNGSSPRLSSCASHNAKCPDLHFGDT